jgi:hypothetical protein
MMGGANQSLHRSKQRAGSTIFIDIAINRQDTTNLVGSDLTLRISTEDRSFRLSKSTTDGTMTFNVQTAERLEATGKILPSDIPILERCRLYFAYELTLPNGDEIYLTEPGHDWFEFYPEVGL